MANTLDIPDYLAAMRALWRGAGWDDRLSCHYERLTADLTPHLVGQRRTLVQARQLYCHSAAYAIGGSGADRHVADALFLALEERFRGADGPWVFALDDEGAVADPRVDFYLHAFLIFAFAHYHGATGAGRAIDHAWYILSDLLPRLAAPNGGWHATGAPDGAARPGPMLQNPHMHLLEACLALHEVAPSVLARDTALSVIALFENHLFDPAAGVLAEVFDRHWRRSRGDDDRVEPGHQIEWAWLLERAANHFGVTRVMAAADRLVDFALAHGHDARRGGLYDSVRDDGTPLSDSKRIWPQTEFVKTFALRYARTGAAADRDWMARGLDLLTERYLCDGGRWREHFDADFGVQTVTDLPGSTPYHIQTALSEVLRTAHLRPTPPA